MSLSNIDIESLPVAICFQPFDFNMSTEYHVCFAGSYPTADGLTQDESAARAAAENQRNGSLTIPIGIDLGPMVSIVEPQSLAVLMGKFWAPGRELRISFVAGTDWQKDQVKKFAPLWCKHANLSMKFVPNGDCDILIDFNPSLGSWSNLGTDSGYVASQRRPSMNLGWINQDQKEENIRGVILHEFGHALGAVHEHESPFAQIPWNKEAVYKSLGGPPNNWDKQKVDGNMFTKYGLDKVKATKFDIQSIMLYHYPAEWTTNGKGTPYNTDLSERDKSYIRFTYPPRSLDAGQFNTMELRPSNQPAPVNTQTKYFWKQYPTAPRVPVGLTSLDIGHEHNIRLTATATDITQENFTSNLNAWSDTILYGASLTYLEAGPGFEYLQTGTFSTTEVGKWQDHKSQNSKRINFAQPFQGEPPKVICWLTTVDMGKDKNWRIKSYVTDVDTKGFTAHIDSWADTVMYQAAITWLAYPANQPNVASGTFSTDDIRPANKPQPENSATVKFAKKFENTPKLAMALSGFDYGNNRNLRLRLSTSGVTAEAVTWHLQSWADSVMYRASAAYFAWA
ncbi:MAG: hypothetical protein L6R42_007119 [Xanthoria sp. 1 TBL-2021]|nr:MAG: hypothetical protein L6R42_007119 [Xanthoria sp. 1 TBL-2021]